MLINFEILKFGHCWMKVKKIPECIYELVKMVIKIQNIKINTGPINYEIAENPLPSFCEQL